MHHHLIVYLQILDTETLPERQPAFVLLHLSGAPGFLMIGRTTIMAESAPLFFLAQPRTSVKNLFFCSEGFVV